MATADSAIALDENSASPTENRLTRTRSRDRSLDSNEGSDSDDLNELLPTKKGKGRKKILKVPTKTLNVIVRHGLKKQGSGDGVESDCVEKATIALSLSDHVTENGNGTSILKDPSQLLTDMQCIAPQSIVPNGKAAVAFSQARRSRYAGDIYYNIEKEIEGEIEVVPGKTAEDPYYLVVHFAMPHRKGKGSSSSSSSSSSARSNKSSSSSTPKDPGLLENPKPSRKDDRKGQKESVRNFNEEQIYAAALLPLNTLLKRRGKPLLSVHQRESIAQKFLRNDNFTLDEWAFDDIFIVGGSGSVKLEQSFSDAVQEGHVDFKQVEGYGSDDSGSSGGGATAIAAAIAQAVNVYAAAHCLNSVSPHQHQPSPAAAVAAPPPPPPQQPLQQPPPQHAPGVFPTPTEVQAASWAADLIDDALDSQFNADWQDVTTLLRLPSWSMSILTLAKTAVRLKTKNMSAEAVAQRLSLVYESTKRLLAI
jgi:hypothetical protein